MGSVSSPFFCKGFRLKDYKEITTRFYVLYRIQIQMFHITKSFIFKFYVANLLSVELF